MWKTDKHYIPISRRLLIRFLTGFYCKNWDVIHWMKM